MKRPATVRAASAPCFFGDVKLGSGAWCGDPARDLRARVEAELVENVPHVGRHGPLRDEKTPADLLVTEALGDELRDFRLALGEYAVIGLLSSGDRTGVPA